MKTDKLTLVCAKCNGPLEVVLMSGPLRVQCPLCMSKVDSAEKTLLLLKDLLEKVNA